MRYSGIAALLVALSGFVAAYPTDDAVFNLEPRCLAAGSLCSPDANGQCCGACCTYCAVFAADDDTKLAEREYPYCTYFCGASC